MTQERMTPEQLADELDRRANGLFGSNTEWMHGFQYASRGAAKLIRTTTLQTEGEKKLKEALGNWIQAVDDLREFERENPNNTTKVWANLLYAEEAAEQAAREALGGQQ